MKSRLSKSFKLRIWFTIWISFACIHSCSKTGKDNPKPTSSNKGQEDATKVPTNESSKKIAPDQAQILLRKFHLRSLAKLPPFPHKKIEESIEYSELLDSLTKQFDEKSAKKAFGDQLIRSYPLNFQKIGSNIFEKLDFIESHMTKIEELFLDLLKNQMAEEPNYNNQEKIFELLCIEKNELNKHQFRNIIRQDKFTSTSEYSNILPRHSSCLGCHSYSDKQKLTTSKNTLNSHIYDDKNLVSLLNECLTKKMFSAGLNTSFEEIRDPLSPTAVLRTYNFRFLASILPKLYAIQKNSDLSWPRKFFEIQLLKLNPEISPFQTGILLDILDWKNIFEDSIFDSIDPRDLLAKKELIKFDEMSFDFVSNQLEFADLASKELNISSIQKKINECKNEINTTCLVDLYFYFSGRKYDENHPQFLNLSHQFTKNQNTLNNILFQFFSSPNFLEL